MLCISSFAGKIIIFWKRFCVPIKSGEYQVKQPHWTIWCLASFVTKNTQYTYMICTNICKYSHIHNLKENRQQQQKKIHKRKTSPDVGTSLFMTVNVANCENDSMSSTQQLLNVVYSYKMKPQQKPPSSRMDKFGSYHYHP